MLPFISDLGLPNEVSRGVSSAEFWAGVLCTCPKTEMKGGGA